MADVYQWRRRIQPAFSHTILPVGEQDEAEPDITSGFGSTRKKVRPKISSYFRPSITHGRSSIWSADQRSSIKETISTPHQTWEGCEPDPDQTMDSIMRTLVTEPYRSLDIKYNSPLLMIFEGFRNLRDENASLMRKLKYEVESRFSSHHELELERQRWQQEREEYKAEVKRLELIISKDKEGVAEVIRARRGSLLRGEHRRRTTSGANTSSDDPRETVFEFLERTRVEDEKRQEAVRKTQRGISTSLSLSSNESRLTSSVPFRKRPVSPSQKMTILSHKLSTTNHYSDFESPPSPQDFTSLSQASMFEMLAGRTSLSDTDSSDNGSSQQQYAEMVGEEEATITNIDRPFIQPDIDKDNEPQLINQHGLRPPSLEAGSAERLTPRAPRNRPESMRLEHERRFSFEYDDDFRPAQVRMQHAADSPLQRSISVDQFATSRPPPSPLDVSNTLTADSVVPSPVRTSMTDFPVSKIPSPVFDPSLARPRREDSSSNFLTAIRASENDSNHSRATSRSSDRLDSPHQSSSLRGSGEFGNSQRHSGRYGGMHNANMAVTAARAAIPSNSPKPSAELRVSYHANA
ncbi:hypothetical protein E4T45_06145 [Aureobasidium sp. EXF-8846]|nr:hypothetical protein E4T45_06145 [Aureobasidium sp. EXF-8846]